MNKVVIVGGLGYIGGRIAKHLSGQGSLEVAVTTRKPCGSPPEWMNGDVLKIGLEDINALNEVFKNSSAVIHLAAMNEIDSARDPYLAAKVNGIGAMKSLYAAINANVPRFLYFSTAHVYGAPLEGHLTESVLPLPIHPYAISHRNAEDWITAAHCQGHISGIVLRLSNGVGSPASLHANRWTLLVNDLCRQAVTHGTLTLRTSGNDLRNFITLEDIELAVDHLLTVPVTELKDGLFNLGGTLTCSVLEMAERIVRKGKKILGKEIPVYRPDKPTAPHASFLNYDWGKLAATGYSPRSNYDTEISDTLKFCVEHFSS